MTQTLAPPANGKTELAKKNLTLKDLLELKRDIIADVLPKHMTPERLIKLATVAAGRDPLLQQATGLSIVNAIIKSAELGLDCSGTLGSAYLVPFKVSKKDGHGNWNKVVEATLIIGYRGLIDLARRSGQILSIEARVVWEKDEFEFEYGLEPRLKHKPSLEENRGAMKLVYGIAKLRDGAMQVEVMSKADIDKIKARSQSAGSDKSPWNTDYPEMARKTVVKRLCKYLPLSVEFQEVIAEDNARDPIDVIDGSLVSPAGGSVNDRFTKRPVSEGQTFEPNPEESARAQAEVAEDASTPPIDEAADELQANDFAQPGASETPAPDVAGADAEPPPVDTVAEALSQSWPDVERILWDRAKARNVSREDFNKTLGAWVLGKRKKGKESEIPLADRIELFHAFDEGRITTAGKITAKQ